MVKYQTINLRKLHSITATTVKEIELPDKCRLRERYLISLKSYEDGGWVERISQYQNKYVCLFQVNRIIKKYRYTQGEEISVDFHVRDDTGKMAYNIKNEPIGIIGQPQN